MKKIYINTFCLIHLFLSCILIPDLYSHEYTKMKIAPLNPKFSKYQMILQNNQNNRKRTYSNPLSSLGLIPDPITSETHQPSITDMTDIPDITLFDLRDPNNDGYLNDSLLTPVRNQLNCGSCWTFATFGALESYFKINRHLPDHENDFSENHMRNSHQFDIAPCSGGNIKMSAAYLVNDNGPIHESEDPYNPLTNEYCEHCQPTRYIDSVIFLPTRFNINDIDYIKRAIYQHGAIYSSIYFDENTYFFPESSDYYYDDPDNSLNDSNHAIVIVGWNDNRIIPGAPDKGAFIVRNSFGPTWGDNGYFYVSYFDESIAFSTLGYFEDHDNHFRSFQKIYQYDTFGWTGSIGSGDGSDWAANVFVADENIEITGVGFYTTGSNMSCTITVYQQMHIENGYARFSNPLLEQKATSFEYSGFYMVPLDQPILVSSGNSFIVVINFSGLNNDYGIPIEVPIMGYTSKATSKAEQSYVSDDGLLFFDLTALSPNSNNCIKAYVSPFVDKFPIAMSQDVFTNEDTPVSIQLSGSDKSNKSIHYMIVSYPLHGLLSGHLPDLIFTPDPDYHGLDGLDFMVSNGTESSESAHITIHIIPVNDPPTVNFSQIQINEDASFSLADIASDPDDDFLYFYIEAPPLKGTISHSFPESLYTPETNYFGQDSFSFYISDGQLMSDDMTLDIEIKPINDKPIVFDLFVTLNEDSQKTIILQGTDIENDPLYFYIVSTPEHGGISGIPPNLIYTPNPDYSGTDSFHYKANDGQIDSETAYCHIMIQPSDDQPTGNDMKITLKEGQSVGFSLSGHDAENTPLTYMLLSHPSFGQLSGTLPDLIYTPNDGFFGKDFLSFQVDDGNNKSDKAIVQLIVSPDNDPPVVENFTISLLENTPEPITLTGTDPNNNPLSFSILNHPKHGELTGDLPNITYVPHNNYSGVDKFSYIANDGYVNSLAGQVLIIVKHINYPPEALSDRILISKNTAKRFYLKASDKNHDTLNLSFVDDPKHGQVSGTFPFATYSPDVDFTGFDSFSFIVNDGKQNSNVAKINIIVTEFKLVTDTIDIDTSAQAIISEDFENDTSAWKFGTDGQTNKWTVGTAESYSSTKSAYISQDNGTTSTYNENASSESWLTRTVDLDGYIDARLSFDWKGVGERFIVYFDYGELYINNGSDILLSDAKEFVNQNTWTHKSFDLSAYAGDQIDLKFKWSNDDNQKDGDPAFCIDNVSITGGKIKPGAGNALNFNGSDAYVAMSDGSVSAASIGMPATITVEAWVKVNSFENWEGIVGFIYDNLNVEGGWVLGVMSANKFYFGVTTQSGSFDEVYYLETDDDYVTNTWYHIAGTYDGVTMRLYVNGVEVASLVPGYDGNIYYRDTYYVIGAYQDSNESYYFDGQIDEVRLWNGARSSEAIRANMCKKLSPDSEPDLLDYYHMDHSRGVFVDDYKGGNNNGILMNMDANTDWVISGAAIGDSTIFDYDGVAASDYKVSLTHADGDQLTVTGDSGHYSGIHLYLIDKPPTNIIPPRQWEPLLDGHYWGVFPVGQNLSFAVNYRYNGLSGIVSELDLSLATRNNATKAWKETNTIRTDTDNHLITTNGSTALEYIPGENRAPHISDIGDQSCPGRELPFSIIDSEGGDITIIASSSDLSLVKLSDIVLSCSGTYSCVLNTTAFVEADLTITVSPNNASHGKTTITILASDSEGHTRTNDFTVIVSPSGSGNAMRFNGFPEYVNIGDINLSNKSFTVEFWAKRTAHTPEYRCVLGQGTALIHKRLFLGFRWEKFRTDFYLDALDSTDSFPDYEWHHWAMSYKETSNDWTFYRDGIVIETGKADNDYQGTGDMMIGKWGTAGLYFEGELDELRIWNGIRTQTDIQNVMCKKLAGSEENLVAYYRFDHSSGTILKDLTDNEHHGNLSSMDDSNWVTSGVLLGIESSYNYTGMVASDFNATVFHSDGDAFSVTGTFGSFEGIHVVQMEGAPNYSNTDKDCAFLDQNRHWGVFPVGSGNMVFEMCYQYSGNPIATDEHNLQLYARQDQTVSIWTAITATQNIHADALTISGITAFEYIIGVINQAPNIAQGDTVSVLMDYNCWPRKWISPTITASDADNDPLTWTIFSGPNHGTVVISENGVAPGIQYTPTHDFIGYDSFVLQVDDGHENGTDTITINVTIASGINAWNLPRSSPTEGASSIVQDPKTGVTIYHMGPGRMIMPRLKLKNE